VTALRIATYNIHRCVGRDGIADPQRVADVLQALDADLVALQEVAFEPDAPGDVLQFLAEAARARAIPGPTLLEGKGRYGNAVLSRIEPREVRRIDISVPGREPRGALHLTMDIPPRSLSVLATHLGLASAERRYQMERLKAHIERPSADVVILMGDFNEWLPWGRSLRRLKRIFAPLPAPATFPSRRPVVALDRIWVRPIHHAAAPMVYTGAPARVASDHLPLVMDLSL